MSEKRARQQQRRKQRKARTRSREGSPTALIAGVAKMAAKSAGEVTEALDAELWASDLMATMRQTAPVGESVDPELFPLFVDALQAVGTAQALAALRALSAVGA